MRREGKGGMLDSGPHGMDLRPPDHTGAHEGSNCMTQIDRPLSRRTALAGLGAGGIGMALATRGHMAAAQDTATDLASHPLTGTWLAMANPALPENPQFPAPSLFSADGSVLLMFPVTDVGPQGVVSQSAAVGVWEAYDEHRGHFTATQLLSGMDGTFLGSVTIDGFPLVSDDGQTFIDDGSLVTVTIRDAAGAVLQVVPPGTPARPVTAIRMSVGSPGFPEATPEAGTPTS
jgi:hypothetical protein